MIKVRVLIIEDEVLIAEDMRWQLTKKNFDVAGMADTGEDALAIAEALRPDLVLMDIRLRGPMSGLEAGRLIEERMGSTVIYVSATCKEHSMPNCISKPFSIAKLSACRESGSSTSSQGRGIEAKTWP
jgi:DNA-binding response OmpR family regulator